MYASRVNVALLSVLMYVTEVYGDTNPARLAKLQVLYFPLSTPVNKSGMAFPPSDSAVGLPKIFGEKSAKPHGGNWVKM